MWTDVLASRGLELTAADAGTIELRAEGRSARFHVHRRSRALRPSEAKPPPSPRCLLLVPYLSSATADRLAKLGWSWATDRGDVHLWLGDHLLQFPSADEDSVRATGAGPLPLQRVRGLGAYAVLRRLIESPADAPMRQAQLADSVGLTQARVSQLLTALRNDGLLESARRRPVLVDRQSAIDRWLAGYPGPRGTVTHWSSLDDMWPATAQVLDALPADSVVSADAAADLLTPWRRPNHAVVYARSVPDLARTGLVQVSDRAQAAVTVCVPADLSVWPAPPITRPFGSRNVALASPLQVLWDLMREPGTDTDQVVTKVREWVGTVSRVATSAPARPQ